MALTLVEGLNGGAIHASSSESAFWYMDHQTVSLDQKGFPYTVEAAVPKAETKRRSWETGFIAKPELKLAGHPPIRVFKTEYGWGPSGSLSTSEEVLLVADNETTSLRIGVLLRCWHFWEPCSDEGMQLCLK
jgi:hypothetical protein